MIEREWTNRALCRGTSDKFWFRKEGDIGGPDAAAQARVRQAKAWCERCPVRRECLTEALVHEQPGMVTFLDMPVFKLVKRDHAGAIVSIRYERKRFTASNTPPVGIWGGYTASERHRFHVKHHEGCEKPKCPGCRPVRERVELLLGPNEEEMTA